MSATNRTAPRFQPRELDTIIARARRERDATVRQMIGSLFGR